MPYPRKMRPINYPPGAYIRNLHSHPPSKVGPIECQEPYEYLSLGGYDQALE